MKQVTIIRICPRCGKHFIPKGIKPVTMIEAYLLGRKNCRGKN